jgi:hypothetical protein
MSLSLKAFILNASYINNTQGQTAPFGELSPYSLTFSQDVGLYSTSSYPNLSLITFTSEDSVTGLVETVPQPVATNVLTIANWIYLQTNAQTGQIFADQLLSQLLITFGNIANTFACGNIIQSNIVGGTYYIPEWVSWIDVSTGAIIKIWFVDASFQSQYDDFEIIVVPPFYPVSNFFAGASKVQGYINAVTYPQQMANVQAASNGFPYTILTAATFSYIDPTNSANTIPTEWTVLIYGPAGNNVDSINNAIVNYCETNSTYTSSQWAAILPDIFLSTEFVFVPFWDQYAIPNQSTQDGIYSPQLNLARAQSLVTTVVPSYPSSHIDTYLNVMSYPYRSLQMGVIGSPSNKDAWYQLIQVFPDIITVPSTSVDFARMAQNTQQFLINLGVMLVAAETMTQFSTLPAGYTSLIRDGQLYIVMNYENIHYLVLAKQDLTTVITGVESS